MRRYDRTHFPGFNVCKHGLKTGALEVRAGKAVVGVPAQIGKAVLLGVGFQNPFLERDLSRVNYTSCPMGILISS